MPASATPACGVMTKLSQSPETLRPLLEKMRQCPFKSVWGISWLYQTNARDQIQQTLLSGRRFFLFPEIVLRILFNVFRFFPLAWRVYTIRRQFRARLESLKGEVFDIVAKSWYVPRKTETEDDFYLGDLQERLAPRGVKLLLLLGNVTGKDWPRFLKRIREAKNTDCLPDLALLRVRDIAGRFISHAWISLFVWNWGLWDRDKRFRRVLKRACLDLLKGQTILNSLHVILGRQVGEIWNPRAVLSLYEGHAWEQCFRQGALQSDIFTKIVGYQHTVILPQALELLQPSKQVGLRAAPDLVLCNGSRSMKMMKPGHAEKGTRFVPFGSFRISPTLAKRSPPSTPQKIMVVPEGIVEEAVFLFETAAEIAEKMPDSSFILRCHPVLPYEKVGPLLKKDPLRLPNVELSTLSKIEEDFERSSILLYRGSSAVLAGIWMGLKPFYIAAPHLSWIDPLFELKEWKEEAESRNLPEKISAFNALPVKTKTASWKKGLKYAEEYVIPVEDSSIDAFLAVLKTIPHPPRIRRPRFEERVREPDWIASL